MEKRNKKKKKKGIFINILIVLLLFLGVSLIAYPYVLDYVNGVQKTNQANIIEKKIEAKELLKDDELGVLIVNSVSIKVPLMKDATWATLERGVGRAGGRFGEKKPIMILGHREYEFSKLQNIKINDEVDIKTRDKDYKYYVDRTEIINQEDLEKKLVEKTDKNKNKDEVILVTCYPFSHFSKPNQRFLVYAYENKSQN